MINIASAFRLLPRLTKLVPTGYLVIAAVALLSVTHGILYLKGREAGLEKYYELKSQVAVAKKEAEADAERDRRERDRINQETADGWAAAVDWHRAHPRIVRVLPGAGCLSQAGALPTAPTAHDGLRPSSGESWLTSPQCEQVANDSVLDREWIELTKKFVQQQHEASR